MSKITKIEKQKKHKERYNIYIDDVFAFGVMENTLIRFQLHQGKSMSNTMYHNILMYDQFQKLYFNAVVYISYRLRSEYEVRQKLERSIEQTEDDIVLARYYKMIDLVIAQLKKDGYINDDQYVDLYIQDTLELSQKGHYAIQRYLLKKGINKQLIQQHLDNISQKQVMSVAFEVGQKYINRQKQVSLKALKQKTKAHLVQKGFPFDICDAVVSHLDYTAITKAQQDILIYHIQLLLKKYQQLEQKEKQKKMTQNLLQKGFEYDDIKYILNNEMENTVE